MELKRALAGLLGGTVTLVRFQRWVGLNSLTIELHDSDEDGDLLNLVASLLDENTGGVVDSAELRDALQTAPLAEGIHHRQRCQS